MLRGCLWRNRVRQEANQELVFVGMKPQVGAWAVQAQDRSAQAGCCWVGVGLFQNDLLGCT